MKTTTFVLTALLTISSFVHSEEIKIDFERAKQLFQKREAGETLTADEQKYLEEARRQHEARNKPSSSDATSSSDGFDWERAKGLHQRVQNGETLNADDQKFYDEAKKRIKD